MNVFVLRAIDLCKRYEGKKLYDLLSMEFRAYYWDQKDKEKTADLARRNIAKMELEKMNKRDKEVMNYLKEQFNG